MVGKLWPRAPPYIPQEIAMTIALRLRRYLESEGVNYETLAHTRTLTSSRSAQAAHISGELLVKSVIVHHELGYVVAVAPSTHRVEQTGSRSSHQQHARRARRVPYGILHAR